MKRTTVGDVMTTRVVAVKRAASDGTGHPIGIACRTGVPSVVAARDRLGYRGKA